MRSHAVYCLSEVGSAMSEAQVELIVRRHGHPDQCVSFGVGTIDIGRAEGNGLVLPDIAVSRKHARLHIAPEAIVLEDVGSGNGTYYRGRPIRKQRISDGDEVLIDPFILLFSRSPTKEEASPASNPPLIGMHAAPHLRLVAGTGLEPRYFLEAKGLRLGRSERQDVVLPDPAASRAHAEIVKRDDRWVLLDAGSVNGCFVNSERVREQPLEDGDRLRIGATEFVFVLPGSGLGDADPSAGTVIRGRAPDTLPPPPRLPEREAPPAEVANGEMATRPPAGRSPEASPEGEDSDPGRPTRARPPAASPTSQPPSAASQPPKAASQPPSAESQPSQPATQAPATGGFGTAPIDDDAPVTDTETAATEQEPPPPPPPPPVPPARAAEQAAPRHREKVRPAPQAERAEPAPAETIPAPAPSESAVSAVSPVAGPDPDGAATDHGPPPVAPSRPPTPPAFGAPAPEARPAIPPADLAPAPLSEGTRPFSSMMFTDPAVDGLPLLHDDGPAPPGAEPASTLPPAPMGPPATGTPLAQKNPSPMGPPNSSPMGPPNGSPMGPPNGSPMGPPNGAAMGPPNGAAMGPPNGAAVGPPNGAPLGPPSGAPLGPPPAAGLPVPQAGSPVSSQPPGTPTSAPPMGAAPGASLPPPPAAGGFAPAAVPGTPAGGGFGAVEMDVAPTKGRKRKKLRSKKMRGAGARQGSFMERHIWKLIFAIGIFAMLMGGVKFIMNTVGDSPKLARRASTTASQASSPAVITSSDGQAATGAVEQLLSQGNAFFREKKFLQAVEKYAAVQKLNPSNATAIKMGYHACEFLVMHTLQQTIVKRGTAQAEEREAYEKAMAMAEDALEGKGTIGAAIKRLEGLLDTFPQDDPLTEMIDTLRKKQRGAAVAYRKRKQKEHEQSISELFDNAARDLSRGDHMAAIQGFERVLGADPEKQTDYYWKAEENIRQAKSELSARGREAYRAGVAAMKGQDYLTARAQFRETLRLDPYNSVAKRRLGEVQGKLDQQAQKFWSEAEIYEKTNQLDMAIGRYRKVMEYCESPSSPLGLKAKKRIDALVR